MATDLLHFSWRPQTPGQKPAGPLLAPAGRVPNFKTERGHLSQGFLSNLRDFLLERPIKVPESARRAFTDLGFGEGFWGNFAEWLKPSPRVRTHSRMTVEWTPWYRTFFENLRDAIAPRKLAP